MPHDSIEPFADGLIEGRLEVLPDRFFPMRSDGGHAFGGHQRFAVGMGRARTLLDEKALVVTYAMAWRARPEFHLRESADAEGFQGIERGAVGPAGFRMDSEAVLRGGFGERPIMLVDDEIGHGAAEVVEKAIAG